MNYNQNNERSLIQQAKKDPEAFGQLYDQTCDRIFSYLLKRTANYSLAEDLTAETYLKALKNFRRYTIYPNKPFIAWLYRIAGNELKMYFRRQKSYHPVELKDYPELLELSKDHQSFQYNFDRDKDYKSLRQALNQLPVQDQTIVSLRYFEEKTIKEIGELLGQKDGTVSSRLSRAMKKMHHLLKIDSTYI